MSTPMESLTSAVADLLSVVETMAGQTPSGGAGLTQGLARARAALLDVNPPPKAPPHPDDVVAETPTPEAPSPPPSSGSARPKT